MALALEMLSQVAFQADGSSNVHYGEKGRRNDGGQCALLRAARTAAATFRNDGEGSAGRFAVR